MKEIEGYSLKAQDGEIGLVKDFYFDDREWKVRYMVADTGNWLPGRKVLIAPDSLGTPDWDKKKMPVELTIDMIKKGPGLDEHKPVSRQHEIALHKFYGWPAYWSMGYEPAPVPVQPPAGEDTGEPEAEKSHIRSVNEVRGYHIQATDGEVGHVDDFILDDYNWMVRYLVVDTRNWLPGRHVLVAPDWLEEVEWRNRKTKVRVTTEEVKNSPGYNPYRVLDREYEEELFDHYGRPKYWA